MKGFVAFLISAAILLSCFCVSAEEAEKHFYIKRGEDHASPTTDPAFLSSFESGDGFYLDAKAAKEGKKVLYLTFDAGYENGNIARILDILKEELFLLFLIIHIQNLKKLQKRME